MIVVLIYIVTFLVRPTLLLGLTKVGVVLSK